MNDFQNVAKLNTIEDCKTYLRLMLNFYVNVINSPTTQEASSPFDEDRNIWLQIVFNKGCHFLSFLNDAKCQKDIDHLKPIIDPSVLFTMTRSLYESIIVFELLFIIPKTEEEQIILYNLFLAHGLSERLKDFENGILSCCPERIQQEREAIADCMMNITNTSLYNILPPQTKEKINSVFGKKFRFIFNEDHTLESANYIDAYKLLKIKHDFFQNYYSYFSLQSHPTYIALIQFRDTFGVEHYEDISIMIQHASQCVLAFMSIFIVDYMKLDVNIKAMYDNLDEVKRYAIGMYEEILRKEV